MFVETELDVQLTRVKGSEGRCVSNCNGDLGAFYTRLREFIELQRFGQPIITNSYPSNSLGYGSKNMAHEPAGCLWVLDGSIVAYVKTPHT